MSNARAPHLSARLQGFGTTIFAEITQLANRHGAVNLGQGFPDFDGPEAVKLAAIAAIREGRNQYARSHGLPELSRAVAEHARRFRGQSWDPDEEITIYSGATEAIAVAFQALLEVGDEVVLFEPFYDSYRAAIAMAGGVARMVTLEAPGFGYRPEALEAAIGAKTRAILVNTPHNPTGKVFGRAELEHVARLCVEHDLLAITDEVYEHMVFEGEHLSLASMPGMRERTITISSTGKTFSLTGWKIGYTRAAPDLTRALRTAHQFVTFCTATPLQAAMAVAFALGDDYYAELHAAYLARRQRLCDGLASVGFEVLRPAGTYFVCVDIRPLGLFDGEALCRVMPERVGVAAIPAAAFYVDKDAGRHLVRFAFCKTDAVLDEGLARLHKGVDRLREVGR